MYIIALQIIIIKNEIQQKLRFFRAKRRKRTSTRGTVEIAAYTFK